MGRRYCLHWCNVVGVGGVSAAQSHRAVDDAELLLYLHAQLAVDVVTNVRRQQDAFECRIVGAVDEVFSNVPMNDIALFLIDANFVGLTRSSIHGLELNTPGTAAKKCCRFDGMDGIGGIESTEDQRNQGSQFQSFWRRRLIFSLHDAIWEMETNGVVLAKNCFITLAIRGINSIERAVLNRSVQAVGAKSALQFIVRHDVCARLTALARSNSRTASTRTGMSCAHR